MLLAQFCDDGFIFCFGMLLHGCGKRQKTFGKRSTLRNNISSVRSAVMGYQCHYVGPKKRFLCPKGRVARDHLDHAQLQSNCPHVTYCNCATFCPQHKSKGSLPSCLRAGVKNLSASDLPKAWPGALSRDLAEGIAPAGFELMRLRGWLVNTLAKCFTPLSTNGFNDLSWDRKPFTRKV